MDMDMSGMDMGSGGSMAPLNDSGVDFGNETQAFNFLQEILDDSDLQVYGNQAATHFWYGAVVVIGLAGIYNAVWRLTLWARLRASQANRPLPAKPRSVFTKSLATVTAIAREASYLQITPTRAAFWVKVPPVGTVLLVAVYLSFVLALEFTGPDVQGDQHDQALGVRAGWLAVAQVPLLILLAGKNNLVGLVAGVSYDRLNVLHRWVARGLLLLASLHFGLQSRGWAQFPGLMALEWQTDTCPPTGIAAYALLLWLNLTTLAPLRRLSYEFFVAQHLLTFFGFIIAIMLHLPSTAYYSRVYIFIPIGLYAFDRIVRTARLAYHNLFASPHATLEPLDHDTGVTRIRVSGGRLKKWAPGSHVLLALPRFGPGQSHPATILSTPTSHGGDLVFILRAFGGFTRRIHRAADAEKTSVSVVDSTKAGAAAVLAKPTTHLAVLDGPYGGTHADFACFDTVVLVAGGTGVTFTTSVLLGLAERVASAQNNRKLPLRVLHFLWVVKKRAWLGWVAGELASATERLRAAGIDLRVDLFVTCDDALTDGRRVAADGSDDGSETSCKCEGDVCSCGVENVNVIAEDKEGRAVVAEPSKQSSRTETAAATAPAQPTLMRTTTAGRPEFRAVFHDALNQAEGETGIGACGPLGLLTAVRAAVVRLSDERAVHKGSGAQGVYLHVESFH